MTLMDSLVDDEVAKPVLGGDGKLSMRVKFASSMQLPTTGTGL